MRSSSGRSRFGGYLPSLLAITALVVDVLFNCFSYAALAEHPEMGNAFRNAIKNDSPIVESYIAGGRFLRSLPGMARIGDDTAAAAAAPLLARVKDFPQGADAVFFGNAKSGAHARMLWGRILMPFLALLAIVLWVRRQKPVQTRPASR
ncbi:MAG: hypothetical protein IT479_09355 [Xanthomonadales bacterium]|nr:hypothetical protein [Xanthomonadales bacterium]MCC6593470.1 hypothetical protein [Xanthomonadales bacterium]MCE7929885.1 hypothetical protein [Xanthomonadales bacterium PRO6]